MRQFEEVVGQLVQIGEKLSDLAVAETVQKKNSKCNWSKALKCGVWLGR